MVPWQIIKPTKLYKEFLYRACVCYFFCVGVYNAEYIVFNLDNAGIYFFCLNISIVSDEYMILCANSTHILYSLYLSD